MKLSSSYISLRTFRKNGQGVDTPVWFVEDTSNKIYLFSAANAGKVKRIKNSLQAELAECDMRGGSLGDWHRCNAYLVDNADESKQAYALLVKRYGWQMRITNFFSRLTGRINHRAVIRLEFSP
ncbi:MAG: PPOX class probable F420-dependent enzyme [Candidatus Azotimanducaceae bacterium]|jgi:PPOX class probable F420-dependent enzyme